MRALLASALLLAGCAGESGDDVAPTGAADGADAAEPAAIAAPAAGAAPATPAAPNTPQRVACAPAEAEIFSCTLGSGKQLSVCADPQASRTTYRFGRGKPELELEGGAWAHAAYSGGGEAQIAFTNKGVRYVVFSRMVRTNFAPGEPNNPAISDGVIVLEGDKVIGLQLCRGADVVPIDYDMAKRSLRRADELFTLETDRADKGG